MLTALNSRPERSHLSAPAQDLLTDTCPSVSGGYRVPSGATPAAARDGRIMALPPAGPYTGPSGSPQAEPDAGAGNRDATAAPALPAVSAPVSGPGSRRGMPSRRQRSGRPGAARSPCRGTPVSCARPVPSSTGPAARPGPAQAAGQGHDAGAGPLAWRDSTAAAVFPAPLFRCENRMTPAGGRRIRRRPCPADVCRALGQAAAGGGER